MVAPVPVSRTGGTKSTVDSEFFLTETYCAIEEVRVACHFSQLHDHIHEPCLALFLASQAIDSVNILFEHAAIPLSLHVRQTHINVNLLF
jgi:hypothetical protein